MMNWYQLTKEQVLEKARCYKGRTELKKAEELLQKNGEKCFAGGKAKNRFASVSQSVCGFACNYSYYCCNYFNVFG